MHGWPLGLFFLCLVGCPRDLQVPEAQGTECDADVACNAPAERCGRQFACIAGRCEVPAQGDGGQSEAASGLNICVDAATPVAIPAQ